VIGKFFHEYYTMMLMIGCRQIGIRSLLFLKKVVKFGRNFSNFDKVLIINLELACSNNGDQDDHMASDS
jgi:hypothetical protein